MDREMMNTQPTPRRGTTLARVGQRQDSPVLLSLQQLPVHGNLHIQGTLDIQQLLVIPQHASQLILGLLEGILQLNVLLPCILQGTVPTLLNITDGGLQAGDLSEERTTVQVSSAS